MSAVKSLIGTTTHLPSPPALAFKIVNAVKDDTNTFQELAEIIKTDPALSSQLLKIANSSLYGLSKKVDCLTKATSLLGTKTLTNIALSFVLVNNLEINTDEGQFDINGFWKRSITNGVAAENLARITGDASQDIFITALLQDIGLLILYNSRPGDFNRLMDEKRVTGRSLSDTEQDLFGYGHADLGSMLLESWNLPKSIFIPIRDHHKKAFNGAFGTHSSLLSIADKISSIYHGSKVNEKSLELHSLLKTRFQMSSETIDELIDDIGEQARELMSIFSIDPGDMGPISVLMRDANVELRKLNLSYEQVVFELQQAKNNAEKLALDLKNANDRLRDLAFYDDLTGLHNHRYFQETFDDELYRSQRFNKPLSLLLLDVDHFKLVNDTYGHLVGDLVLQEVSKQMARLVRQSDIVARYGGEEFAIILPETSLSGAKVLGQRLRRGIEQLEILAGVEKVRVTICIGIAGTEMEGVDFDKTVMISQADEALYLAKKNGRNRVEMLQVSRQAYG